MLHQIKLPFRKPSQIGEVLVKEFLSPKGMTQTVLAKKMGVPIQRVNTLISGKRGVTPETAILLAQVLGTSPEFWMNMQTAIAVYRAAKKLGLLPK